VAEKNLRDPRLRPFLDRARIDCDLFAYKCPLSWGSLRRTGSSDVRYCYECSRNVTLVTSEAQLIQFASEGRCVAVIRSEELPDPATLSVHEFYEDDDDDDDDDYVMGEILMDDDSERT
jgi:hypothetical protein